MKGVALIIAVFAMLVFSVLGWTLANMQATDFQANTRGNLDSERALYLAESGAQWALNRLSINSACRSQGGLLRCPPPAPIDSDCNDNGDWLTNNHNLSPGQYDVCVRDPISGSESGDAVIVARGYVPSETAGDKTMRQVKLEVDLGSLSNVLQTPAADPDDPSTGLFDWSLARAGHLVQMEGNIEAGHYESDGDATPDEVNIDYDTSAPGILPDDINPPENETRGFTASYPSIDMVSFYDNPAYSHWPPDARTVSIETTVNPASSGTTLRVSTAGFFTDGGSMRFMAVHNISDDLADDGQINWGDAHWRVIESVASGTRATVDSAIGDNWDGDTIRLVRRFYDRGGGTDYTNTRIYAGRQEKLGGETADMLIDLNDGDVRFQNSSLISEGDIVIKGLGNNELRMFYTAAGTIYPMLASKAGNILSTDLPGGGSETNRVDRRRIAGLIYSESGLISFHYLRYPTSGPTSRQNNLVYGNRITLDGRIRLRYNAAVSPSSGFIFKPSTLSWREE